MCTGITTTFVRRSKTAWLRNVPSSLAWSEASVTVQQMWNVLISSLTPVTVVALLYVIFTGLQGVDADWRQAICTVEWDVGKTLMNFYLIINRGQMVRYQIWIRSRTHICKWPRSDLRKSDLVCSHPWKDQIWVNSRENNHIRVISVGKLSIALKSHWLKSKCKILC